MNKGKKAQKVATKQETFNPKNYEKNGLTEDDQDYDYYDILLQGSEEIVVKEDYLKDH